MKKLMKTSVRKNTVEAFATCSCICICSCSKSTTSATTSQTGGLIGARITVA